MIFPPLARLDGRGVVPVLLPSASVESPGLNRATRVGRKVYVAPRWRHAQDRKSTRLNSSHLVISYAVFCLKKKKSKSCTTLSSFLRVISASATLLFILYLISTSCIPYSMLLVLFNLYCVRMYKTTTIITHH